jgi:hypothetical protein
MAKSAMLEKKAQSMSEAVDNLFRSHILTSWENFSSEIK